MGSRKKEMADRLKEIKKTTAIAKLNDVPTSPRKMRLVADMIRGVEVNHALDILKYTKREASIRLEKLLRSAIANWEAKNEGARKELEDGNVIVQNHHGRPGHYPQAYPYSPSGPCRTYPQTLQPCDHRCRSETSKSREK